MYGKLMENFRHAPDTTDAVKVGEPTLVDPKQASAPDFVRNAASTLMIGITGGVANPPGQAANAGTPPAGTAPAGTAAASGDNTTGAEILPSPSAGGTTASPAPNRTHNRPTGTAERSRPGDERRQQCCNGFWQ